MDQVGHSGQRISGLERGEQSMQGLFPLEGHYAVAKIIKKFRVADQLSGVDAENGTAEGDMQVRKLFFELPG